MSDGTEGQDSYEVEEIDYEVTYPLTFVVNVEEGASTERIIEAWGETAWQWSQEGNLPVEEFVEIRRLHYGVPDNEPPTSKVASVHQFPIPFGGIEWMIQVSSSDEMHEVVDFLTNDGHLHNFAVAMDGLSIWVSELGARCIADRFEEFGELAKGTPGG